MATSMLSKAHIIVRNSPNIIKATTLKFINTWSYPLQFQVTPILSGEPLKKKKRIDPAIIKRREERKRKRIEKGIRQLERLGMKLKPLEELEVPKEIRKELDIRKRETQQLSFEEAERRARIERDWSRHKLQQHLHESNMINRILAAQEKALAELKNISEKLYEASIQVDPSYIPFAAVGPVATPPIKGYEPPNGIYVDTTRKWDKKILPPMPLVKPRKRK